MTTPQPGTAAPASPSQGFRTRVRNLGEPVALFFGRIGLTPNALTILGFLITVAGAVLAAAGLWLLAGIVVFLGGAFDMFDGALARATGKASKVGAFLDSVFDRWGESVVYIGIVIGCLNAGFQLGAGLAAVGDVRGVPGQLHPGPGRESRPEHGQGHGSSRPRTARGPPGHPQPGPADRRARRRRPGRPGHIDVPDVCYVDLGLPTDGTGAQVLAVALGLIAILATITVIQRIIHVTKQAATSDGK